MGKIRNSKWLAITLLLAMVLNVFAPFIGIGDERIYAEEGLEGDKNPKDLALEYFPGLKLIDFSQWKERTRWGQKVFYTDLPVPSQSGAYNIRTGTTNRDRTYIGVSMKPIDGKLQVVMDSRLDDGAYVWVGGLYTNSDKEFKENNIYRLGLNIEKISNDREAGKFYLKEVETDKELEVIENTLFEGNYDERWQYYKPGPGYIEFLGTGEKAKFITEVLPLPNKKGKYTFSDFSLQNITPASIPSIDNDNTSDSKVAGTANKAEGDRRESFQGDIVQILVDGAELARVEVGEDNKWTYNFKDPIEDPSKVSYKIINPDSGLESGEVPHPEKEESHKIRFEKVEAGKKVVRGKGYPGDTLFIVDQKGIIIGKGEINKDGNFEIELERPLVEGETIAATPYTGNTVHDSTEITVKGAFNPKEHKPEVNPVKEGDKKVTGTGVPGDEIVITDKDGNELGKGTVGEDGKFEIELNRPLEKGETITATPKTGENEGEGTEKEVEFNPEDHTPKVDEDTVKEGSKEITGKGKPGDEIVITDKDGNALGKGTVDEDGNFKLDLE